MTKLYLVHKSWNLRKRRCYIQSLLHYCKIHMTPYTQSSYLLYHSLFFLRYRWSNPQGLYSPPSRYDTQVSFYFTCTPTHTHIHTPQLTCHQTRPAMAPELLAQIPRESLVQPVSATTSVHHKTRSQNREMQIEKKADLTNT